MKSYLLQHAISLIVMVFGGVIIKPLMELLKRGIAALDTAPDAVKNFVVVLLASAVTALSAVIGQQLPTDVHEWSEATLKLIVTALIPILAKKGEQVNKLKGRNALLMRQQNFATSPKPT